MVIGAPVILSVSIDTSTRTRAPGVPEVTHTVRVAVERGGTARVSAVGVATFCSKLARPPAGAVSTMFR